MISHKLLFHSDEIFKREPVSLNICPTGKCNLNCEFCYIKNRPMDDLEIEKILHVVDSFFYLKSVQIGMGEPTMYPYLNQLIMALHKRGLKIGIGTNGIFLTRIWTENLYKISWMQIGITKLIDEENYVSYNWLPCKFNFIYVFHDKTPDDIIDRLRKFREFNMNVSKFDVNLDNNVIIGSNLDLDFFGFKRKYKGEEGIDINDSVGKYKPYRGVCHYAYIFPMLLNDGWLYPCCVETNDFRHAIQNRICKWDDIHKYKQKFPLEVKCDRCSKVNSLNLLDKAFNDEDKEFVF